MLYYNFNYKEFTYRFGFTEHDNGKKSRRNKVLLNFIKDKNLLKECIKKNDFKRSGVQEDNVQQNHAVRRI